MRQHLLLPGHYPGLVIEAHRARTDPYATRELLVRAASGGVTAPAEVVVAGWVFSPDFRRTLLVLHKRYGWLSPGGRLEEDELPWAGARREVAEETGLYLPVLVPEPVAVLGDLAGQGRKFGLAYAFVADPAAPIQPEPRQPASWFDIVSIPPSYYPLDHEVLPTLARDLRDPSGR